ncbi:uncharacterized protein NECHADRAFT_82758 [Fusarium vanettenii 77-13-4]|uniref:Uncharacterized protein n=1 Tax=Fusarium vanettenii (strain ATCC MYA-4622 / CBS 123669 / FGSC 9596 / NRRL 45880 / 77-13-4) TaxID=660122 RepID=C7YWR6_FUSV7|nr:uncharacterized protein NECHADRAFT_82758 [Fusarium vanettenii 77-13-4]EEU43451.1 hypothetical protein NECHADRAFT_82758 [Fusarium vanettenii 77-13-4]
MRSSHLCYPSPEEGIPEVREELGYRPWGLVTYRTAYGGHSDREFFKLRELIHNMVLKFQESDDKRFPMGQTHWPVVEDKKLLSNVTTQVVREQFSKWASDRGVPPSEDGWKYQVARFHYCLVADRRSLKSAETTFPIIGVLYKDWLPAWHPDRIGHEGKYVPDDWTPIEGNTEGDVGWFYCRIVSLGWYYDEMCVRGLWGKTPRLPCVSLYLGPDGFMVSVDLVCIGVVVHHESRKPRCGLSTLSNANSTHNYYPSLSCTMLKTRLEECTRYVGYSICHEPWWANEPGS